MDKILVFYGADHAVGTSQIALSTAEILSNAGERVLYIDASGELYDGYTDLGYEYKGIDQILREINPQQAVIQRGKLDYILGVRATAKMKYEKDFFPKVIGSLPEYNHIIIDAGSDARDELSLRALEYADKRYFIVRQNPKTIDKFRIIAENILNGKNLYSRTDEIIINAIRKSKMLYTKEQVEAALLKKAYALPYIKDAIKCEYARTSLAAKSRKYRKALHSILRDSL